MQHILIVGAGGALGAIARHLVSLGFARWVGTGFPWATLAVNVAGSLLIGVSAALLLLRWPEATGSRLFLTTGLLGGFTTFSAFSLDFVALVERGGVGPALFYAAATVILSIAACLAGLAIARNLLT